MTTPTPSLLTFHHAEYLLQQMAEAQQLLPGRLKRSRYWLPALLIFQAGPDLRQFIPTYFDYGRETIDIERFSQTEIGYLSSGQAALAALAFHLFNDRHTLPGLSFLSGLDGRNFELALFAIILAKR